MKIPTFYKIIDDKINLILEKYKNDPIIVKNKKDKNVQKSYALLIWFLNFYGRKSNYTDYITDGHDDSSCDIVFDNTDGFGITTFYIVQSKWNTEKNATKETNKGDISKTLSDFNAILRGEKKEVNDKLKSKLEALDKHLKSNGTVKFIFLSLAEYKGNADENIRAFIRNDEKIKFEIIDINRIKIDFIDREYKKIEPINPLERYENPQESPIQLDIVQKVDNFVKIERPFQAYMLLLKPKTIHELFDKYGFALFYKNVRNPLLKSQFNKEIKRTVIENPAYFWYYNNGITAITYIMPSIGRQAETITVRGLQIINGAQTVYSIYEAYKEASPLKRLQMDTEALITLRLLKSGGKDFDLNVTRYTNSQNPISDRDFCANDNIQIKLQKQSYLTEFWYEKRRDEFREMPENVKKIPNHLFANLYLAYHLQDPVSVLNNHIYESNTNKDLAFVSHKEHKDGLYEKIFNEKTNFEDMLCAFYIFDVINNAAHIPYVDTFESHFYHLLALFKVAFNKYLISKHNNKNIQANKEIIKIYEKKEYTIILQIFTYLSRFVRNQLEIFDNEIKNEKKLFNFLFELSHYEKVKNELEETLISVNDIENIDVSDNDIIIETNEEGKN